MSLQKVILPLLCLSIISCVSRLGRPELLGVVTDFDGNPIEDCSVGETVTDENGHFTLSERRYHEFMLTLEAPPLMVLEIINKEGYENKDIHSMSTFGGSGRKGSQWDLDTIRLKKVNQKIPKLNNTQWEVSTNKAMDTIYFIKSNFRDICKTRLCQNFYSDYHQYTDNYLDSFGKNNLPEGVIRKMINVGFGTDSITNIRKVTQYGKKEGGWSEKKPNDTLQISGKWNINNKNIIVKSELKELRGTFQLSLFDYEYMQWVKVNNENTEL